MKKILMVFSLVVCTCLTFIMVNSMNFNNANEQAFVRTIELNKGQVNSETYFQSFDDYDLVSDGRTLSFSGYNTINLNEFFEVDFVSDGTYDENIVTKYICDYDMKNSIVSLSIAIVHEDIIEIIDKIYGVVVLNDQMEFDVSFDVEGEVLLLSELSDVEIIENCGFFKNLASKIKKAVVSTVNNVVDTTKKVCSTTSGKIGTIATVAACAVAGTVCAVIPGCQVGTAIFVGMAIGYIGASTTAAVSTYQQDGTIDWNAVNTYGQCGAIVGGAVSGISYGVTTGISNIITSGAKNASVHAKNSPYCTNGNCFAKGTLVLTIGGYKKIEDIKTGDLVLSNNVKTNKIEYKKVNTIFRNLTTEWVNIMTNNEEIKCTPNHLFYSSERGWVTALEITIGDKLVDSSNNEIIINSKNVEKLSNCETTYNFEVEDFNTYYVSEGKILTHNACKKFNSYKSFQNEYGKASEYSVKYGKSIDGRYEWHHIVEQNQIAKGNALATDIYNIDNTISLGYDTHKTISGIYSSNIENLGKYGYDIASIFKNVRTGRTVRAYMSTLSYSDQYQLGVQILRALGVCL